MAFPTSFAESNEVLDAPPGMGEIVGPLSVIRLKYPDGTPCVISCHKLTADEMAEVNRTGRVWLVILGGTMAPASVSGIKPFMMTPTEGDAE